MPSELREQVPLIQELLTAMGIKIVSKGGYEADDTSWQPLRKKANRREWM